MSICRYCGNDTGDTNHRLVGVQFPKVPEDKFLENLEHTSEKWMCIAKGETYKGNLSEEATEEARKDYSNRSGIFWFDNLIKRQPENSKYHKERGKIYLAMGEYKRANDDFSDALNFRRDDGELYYLRSEANRKLGRLEKAEQDRNMAVRKCYSPPE